LEEPGYEGIVIADFGPKHIAILTHALVDEVAASELSHIASTKIPGPQLTLIQKLPRLTAPENLLPSQTLALT
jgi:hypothetical protein